MLIDKQKLALERSKLGIEEKRMQNEEKAKEAAFAASVRCARRYQNEATKVRGYLFEVRLVNIGTPQSIQYVYAIPKSPAKNGDDLSEYLASRLYVPRVLDFNPVELNQNESTTIEFSQPDGSECIALMLYTASEKQFAIQLPATMNETFFPAKVLKYPFEKLTPKKKD